MMWDDVFNSLWDEIMKERMKKNMKLEYKFYEKNLAPKWLEGDYNLHIEGNRMTMTSKDGVEVKARCHPDDDWRLQVGIDESAWLKQRSQEKLRFGILSNSSITLLIGIIHILYLFGAKRTACQPMI